METLLQSILSNIQNRKQLQVLLKKAQTTVVFSTENKQWYLYLSQGELDAKNNKSTFRIHISGDEASLLEAASGRLTLSQLQKLGLIKVQGNYRQILLVEALLLLCRERECI